jgi:hypothetical protein
MQVEQAVRICPLVPTPRATGVLAAEAEIMLPFAVRIEGAIAEIVPQQRALEPLLIKT